MCTDAEDLFDNLHNTAVAVLNRVSEVVQNKPENLENVPKDVEDMFVVVTAAQSYRFCWLEVLGERRKGSEETTSTVSLSTTSSSSPASAP